MLIDEAAFTRRMNHAGWMAPGSEIPARGVRRRTAPDALLDAIREDGVLTRAGAEHLLALDRRRQMDSADDARLLVGALTDFIVWQERPTGRVGREMAEWLLKQITPAPTPNMVSLMFAIVREADTVPECLMAAAMHPAFADRRLRGR